MFFAELQTSMGLKEMFKLIQVVTISRVDIEQIHDLGFIFNVKGVEVVQLGCKVLYQQLLIIFMR